jgi:hypothetical protein
MRLSLVSVLAALAVCGCGDDEPRAGAPQRTPQPETDKRPGRLVALYGQMVSDFHWGVDYGRIDDVELSNKYFRSAERHGSRAHRTARAIGVTECTPALSGPGS